MTDVAARERMSAWQRWELASLSDPTPGPKAAPKGPSAEELLAAARAQAAAEGFAEGLAAGRKEGIAEARNDRAKLAQVLSSLSNVVADHEQRLVDEVLDLSLVLARQIVGEALGVRRDLLLPVVSAALKQLPQATQRIEIALNPADLTIVRAFLETELLGPRCQLVGNAAIAPGGCRVETEQCEIDATVTSRWKRLLAALGRSDDWLEPA